MNVITFFPSICKYIFHYRSHTHLIIDMLKIKANSLSWPKKKEQKKNRKKSTEKEKKKHGLHKTAYISLTWPREKSKEKKQIDFKMFIKQNRMR